MADLQRSYNQYIDAVINEGPTNHITWTWGFSVTRQEVDLDASSYVALSADRKAYFTLALNQFATVCNLTFTEVPSTDNPEILAAYNLAGDYSGVAMGNSAGSTLLFNTSDVIPKLGTFGFHNYLHEIGHALSLRHGQDVAAGFKGVLPADHFSYGYSQVAYASPLVGGGSPNDNNPQSLGLDDIRALQYKWGANYGYNSADTTYTWDAATGAKSIQNGNGQKTTQPDPILPRVYEALWDGGGIDTYDLSNFTKAQTIDLRPGAWSTISTDLLPQANDPAIATIPGNVANAYLAYDPDTQLADLRSLIENVNAGSGNDNITGNQANNVLNGNAGNDALYGLTGADTLNGGTGNDTLDGGEDADLMVGGSGDDTYYIDNTADIVVETATGGADSII